MDKEIPLEDSFGLAVSKCEFIPKGIKCLKIKQHPKLFIAVWKDNNVVIYNFNDITDKHLFKKQKHVDKDRLEFSKPIINIFMTSFFIYAVDISGIVYELHYRVNHLDESKNKGSSDADMFEMSPGCLYGWVQTELGVINQCDKLLATSVTKKKLVAISIHAGKLLGHVYKIGANKFKCVFVITLLDTIVDKVHLTCIDTPFSSELKEKYFSFLSRKDTEVAVVGLSSGQCLAFPVRKQPEQPHVLFSSSHHIIGIDYVLDKHQQMCIGILVLVSSGPMMLLDGRSSQMFYVTGSVLKTLFNRHQSVLVTSDGVDCTLTKIKFDKSVVQESSSKSEVKGMRAVCTVPDIPDVVLISTQHRCVYWLDLSIIPVEDSGKFVMPDSEVLEELISTANKLGEANSKMIKDDSIMKAISLASRGKFLKNYFTILMKFYSGKCKSDDKLKLRIDNDCEFATFTPDLWVLQTVISFKEGHSKSFVHKLDKIFSKDYPLMIEFKCSPNIESELSCKLVASLHENKPLLIVPLGKVVIDAGYFLSFVTNKAKLKKHITNIPVLKMDNLESECIAMPSLSNNVGGCVTDNQKIVVCPVKLNSSLAIEKTFQILFRNSSHRMSKNQWLRISDPNVNEITAAIGEEYWVEMNLNKTDCILTIKSNDIYACYLVKRSVCNRFSTDNEVELNADVYIEAEGLKYQYELARMNKDWNLKTFQDIKNQFRSDIVNKFPT